MREPLSALARDPEPIQEIPTHILVASCRAFLRARGLERIGAGKPFTPPTGWIASVVSPLITEAWMASRRDAYALVNGAEIEETVSGKIDLGEMLRVKISSSSSGNWLAECQQASKTIARVTWKLQETVLAQTP